MWKSIVPQLETEGQDKVRMVRFMDERTAKEGKEESEV
jgi:hypothetical protein